ncbi:TPA: tail fiber protein [Stenotrophomonas maltophilia]
MQLKITTAGRAALLNASRTGTNSVKIAQIGLTSQAFTPKGDGSDTTLPGEFKRLTTFGGKATSNDTIHVTIRDESNSVYTLRGIALYLENGVLFGIYGQAGAILEKAAPAMMLLSADVKFTTISATSITFGNADFLNPVATTDQVGVVELATITEAEDGNDTARAVTPRGLRAYIDKRFGVSAPTTFARNILAMATATALRQALELKGAALMDMGHGKGLDADTLDGKHASDFPQVGEVQASHLIATNSAQKRWIKLGTLLWVGSGASILMLEITCGGIGGRRFVTDFVSASTRGFDTWLTALTPAYVDAMVYPARLGGSDALNDSARYGMVLIQNSDGVSTGVELWMLQGGYNHGHRVRPVNVLNTTYHGVKDFATVEPTGIVYATVEPVASVSDIRRLVEGSENRWGRRQTFALGLSLPSDQTVNLGAGGGDLRGTDTGSVVLAAGAGPTGDSGGYVYLRPNGSANPAGQLAVYKNGFTEMGGARIGTGSGDGKVLCELYSERPWQFKQGGTEGQTGLELHDITGGKEFRLTNVANPNKIVLNPTGSWVYAAEFRGKLTGNADTASKLAAPRTINGTAFDGSANIVSTAWGASRKVTIGNTAKDVNGGVNFGWTLAEIGAGSAADVAARVAFAPRTQDGSGWLSAYDTYRSHLRSAAADDSMPSAYTNAISLPTYDNARGLALASDFSSSNRFWLRSRHDSAGTTPESRWKPWAEVWTNVNFKPADKLDRAGGVMTGILQFETASALRFKATTPTYFQGPDGAGDNVINFTRNGKADYTMNVFGSLTVGGERVWHTGNFAPSTKANRIPGQVIMFAGKSAPAGTLLCDGAAVSRTTYAELFAAIGTLYGAGDGKTTFNLPAMLEGTVVTHTQKPETVGTPTNGEVIRHAHGASSASAGNHSHSVSVAAGGAHSHGASANAVPDHAHNAWTDSQGHHAHTGSTSASGDHQHISPFGDQMPYPWGQYGNRDQVGTRASGVDQDNSWPLTNPAGNHTHAFTTDGAGAHAHNIGMNGAGGHSHTITVAQAADHSHTATAAESGAHTHGVTVANTGGDRNLPAGLRMIYCITY